MGGVEAVDPRTFKRILARNVALPLALSALLSAVFIALVLYLLSVSRWVDHTDQVISKANKALKLVVDSETGLRGFLLTGQEEFLEPYVLANQALPAAADALQALVADNPSQVTRAESLFTRYEAWRSLAEGAIARIRKNPKRRLAEIDLRAREMEQIRAGFGEFVEVEEGLRSRRAAETTEVTYLLIAATLVLTLGLGSLIAMGGRSQLLSLSASYEAALRKHLEQNELLNFQAWLRSGHGDLSERILGDLFAAEVGTRALAYLAERLGARLGAFYLLHGDGYLTRQATYAGGGINGNQAPERLRLGEGLLGEAALSRKPIVLNEVPSDYVRISSSLGSTLPRHVIVFPFTADGSVNSVVELGFIDHPGERALELLRMVAENVGVAVRSAAYRARLQELLHESQQLTEELQTQQEELRTSNEELVEQSRALQEAQSRLESQHAELEQTNEQLEEQKSHLDRQNAVLSEARAALERKARELETANQYKSEFLANMSHELRTPLNSSLILAKLLKDNPQGNLTEEQVEFASTIYSAGNDLLELINDILDLAKVEAGKLEVRAEPVPLDRLVGGLERMFKPMAEQKGLEFSPRLEPSLPESIETDPQRVEQILKNLLSNALKFTRAGSVRLVVKPAGAEGRIAFSVVDTGVGIDPSQQEVIFEAFRQADGTINRQYGGTGLGLTISRNLATLLGGTIEVESRVGEGSVFTLVLPAKYRPAADAPAAAPVPASPARPRPAAPPRKPSRNPLEPERLPEHAGPPPFPDDRDQPASPTRRTLLVVEDDTQFARILLDLAREQGFRVLVAGNTADGYLLAKEHLPDSIVLDMKLPDALGLSLLDRLKSNPKTRHIPVHAVSAMDYSREAKYLGAAGYVLKPTSRDELRGTLRALEEKISQKIKRVLLVEDDEVQRTSIHKLIGGPGVEIVPVALGQEALDHLKATTFDCMVIDLTLPDMSGFDLLEKMAQGQDFSFPPVIVYTGRSLSRAEEDRLRRYSRTIIIKGARSPERLLDEVTLFLHRVESQMSPDQQRMLKDSLNREKAFEGRKILLVDDDVRNIYALTAALERKGAAVRIARNGKEALKRLADEPQLDLVLMDIMMPEMDGYEAMRQIRGQDAFGRLPIIAVTAKAMRDDYEKCLEAGANDYLSKPIDLDKLVSLMRVWLPKPLGRD